MSLFISDVKMANTSIKMSTFKAFGHKLPPEFT